MFHEILYRPLFNLLVFLYQTAAFGDLGVAIILLTLLIRVILAPVFYKSMKQQTSMQKLQPEIKKIQAHYKGNMEKQGQAIMELYKTHRVSPFSGFFLLLIQIPVLLALFQIFKAIVDASALADVYSFIPSPGELRTSFLGLISLEKPNMLMGGFAALFQYLQGRFSLPRHASGGEMTPAERVGKSMVLIGPVVTFFVLRSLPAAIALYWAVTALFSMVQQYMISRSMQGPNIPSYGNAPGTHQNDHHPAGPQ